MITQIEEMSISLHQLDTNRFPLWQMNSWANECVITNLYQIKQTGIMTDKLYWLVHVLTVLDTKQVTLDRINEWWKTQ